MTIHELLVEHESRLVNLQAALALLRIPHGIAIALMVAALVLSLVLGAFALRSQLSSVWPSLSIIAAGISAGRARRIRRSQSHLWRLIRHYNRAVQRLNGNWADSVFSGEEFCDSDHVFARDLNVVGEGSLFQLLCTARSAIGRNGLADYLLNPSEVEESLLRQQAVIELQSQPTCGSPSLLWASSIFLILTNTRSMSGSTPLPIVSLVFCPSVSF